MNKRLILLLDGTWNDPEQGETDTNIVRLRELISKELVRDARDASTTTPEARITLSSGRPKAPGKQLLHKVYYERGVGTGGFLDWLSGGAFGAGLYRNVQRAFLFIADNYQPGDEVFVFGFSRGSYTARSLVGLLSLVGLPRPEGLNEELLSEIWSYYRTSPSDRLPISRSRIARSASKSQVRITCLGVFDTVGALGVPLEFFFRENRDLFGFHDVSASPIVGLGLHALAIDEHRSSFEAALWRLPKYENPRLNHEQVWFTGAHADVGGGYIEAGKRHDHSAELDDVSLDWMLKRIKREFPDFPASFRDCEHKEKLSAQPHESRTGLWRLTRYAERSIGNVARKPSWGTRIACLDRHSDPLCEFVHVSALERLAASERRYRPQNLIAALQTLRDAYTEGSRDRRLLLINWSAKPLDPDVEGDRKLAKKLIRRSAAACGLALERDEASATP